MTIEADSRKVTPGALVDLYVLDLNPIGVGQVYYFYPANGPDDLPISYLGNNYIPWPIEMTGFEKRGSGSEARPKAAISNMGGVITEMMKAHDDLIGAHIKRRRTLSHYVLSDSPEYSEESYFIEQKISEDALTIEFELASAMDFIDKSLPGRIAIANSCPWRYKTTANGSGCSWAGLDPAKWFDRNGSPVFSADQDDCGKRLSDCKLRFGDGAELDYGGFTSLGRNG